MLLHQVEVQHLQEALRLQEQQHLVLLQPLKQAKQQLLVQIELQLQHLLQLELLIPRSRPTT